MSELTTGTIVEITIVYKIDKGRISEGDQFILSKEHHNGEWWFTDLDGHSPPDDWPIEAQRLSPIQFKVVGHVDDLKLRSNKEREAEEETMYQDEMAQWASSQQIGSFS